MTLIALKDAELAFGLTPLLDRAALAIRRRSHRTHRAQRHRQVLLVRRARRHHLRWTTARCSASPGARGAGGAGTGAARRGHACASRCARAAGLHDIADERERQAAETRLVEFLHRFSVNEDASPAAVSGGERKRAALALAFALDPDLLLLDEPTNHLDVDGIETLEELLQRNVTCVVVTHDRRFSTASPRASSNSIAGGCARIPGNYSVYEQRKADIDAAEDLQTAASTSSGRRKKSGSARASRRGARATRVASTARTPARGTRRAARTARLHQAHASTRGALGQAGGRARERRQGFGGRTISSV